MYEPLKAAGGGAARSPWMGRLRAALVMGLGRDTCARQVGGPTW